MDKSQLLELKEAIEKRLLFEIVKNAAKIDVWEYPRPRFVLEFNFDQNGLLQDAAVETRFRRGLKTPKL